MSPVTRLPQTDRHFTLVAQSILVGKLVGVAALLATFIIGLVRHVWYRY